VASATDLETGMLGYLSASAVPLGQIPFNLSNPKLASVTKLAFKLALFKLALKSYSDMLAMIIAALDM
jgi:hypothetical protein